MQMQTLEQTPEQPPVLPLATMIKLADFDPDREAILDRAMQPDFAHAVGVQSVLRVLAKALEDNIYWGSILRREIWPMRRRCNMRPTDRQRVLAREVEQAVVDSWTKVTVHIETLGVLTR